MDRLSKKLLRYMLSSENPAAHVYNQANNVEDMAKYARVDKETAWACIKHLASEGFVEISTIRKDITIFKLSHKALHKSEFSWLQFKAYLADHWIDIAALIVSGIALYMSIVTRSMIQ